MTTGLGRIAAGRRAVGARRGPRPDPDAAPDVQAVQRRTVHTLVGSQIVGGIGITSGIAVGSILAAQILGSADLAGLANTAQVLGAAVLTAPMARLMAARGRRAGLVAGYLTGALGAGLAVLAALAGSFALLLAGTVLFGAATTANGQARYAATDLAAPSRHARALGLVVWATTVGAVAGPNLIAPAGRAARALALPDLSGAFVFSLAGFAAAAAILAVRLRPDPLLLARAREPGVDDGPGPHPTSVRRSLRVIRAHPDAVFGTVVIAVSQTVMVAVMVMTPLHMHDGGATLRLVGLVVSIHVLGMYAFSPAVGWLADHAGERVTITLGLAVLLAAAGLAGTAPAGMSAQLTGGLFLLGLGWSLTMIAGSSLLATAVPVTDRPGVQGTGDLIMGLTAAAGSALAGVVVGAWGFGWLCAAAAAVTLLPLGVAAVHRPRTA
jgi:MFS family permease